MYVGHSINLYNRISSYFMYLNKHGFSELKLTIYIMDIESSLDQVIALEQHFIDTLKPNLNVDVIASGFGHHNPMTQEMRDMLRKQRGTPVYIYDAETLNLLYIFEAKQQMYNSMNIHHSTLNNCLDLGSLYLGCFFLSLYLLETAGTNLLSLDEIKSVVVSKRDMYKTKHPAAKGILAEFKYDTSKNLEFDLLKNLAKHLSLRGKVIVK